MTQRFIDLASLGRSPLLDDVGERDRSIPRLLLTIVLGLVGAGLLTVVVLALGAVVFAIQQVAAGATADEMTAAISALLDPNAAPTFNSIMAILGVVALANTALFGGFVAIAALVNRRKLKSYITAAPRFRWNMLWAGLLLFVLLLGPVIWLEVVLNDHEVAMPILTLAQTTPQRITYFLVALVALLFAAGVEELLCRGWLLKQTAAWSRNFWVLAIVNGVIFSALHFPDTDPNAFIGRALMAVGFCYMALRTGGIEFATGAHTANNLLLILFVQTPPLSPAPPEPLSAQSNISTLVAVAGYVLITEIVMRWEPLRRWAKPDIKVEPAQAQVF